MLRLESSQRRGGLKICKSMYFLEFNENFMNFILYSIQDEHRLSNVHLKSINFQSWVRSQSNARPFKCETSKILMYVRLHPARFGILQPNVIPKKRSSRNTSLVDSSSSSARRIRSIIHDYRPHITEEPSGDFVACPSS